MSAHTYPPTWDKTITLYNRKVDKNAQIITWQRTLLEGCSVTNQTSRQQEGNDVYYADSFLVRIPASNKFIPSHEWQQLANTTERFTLSPGDLVFIGNMIIEIDETESGKRVNDHLNEYKPDCFTVKLVKNNAEAPFLRHYRIEGF